MSYQGMRSFDTSHDNCTIVDADFRLKSNWYARRLIVFTALIVFIGFIVFIVFIVLIVFVYVYV